jgi:nicotinate-nucleotide pyrophosphorylase (carboxylating)
MGHLSGIATLTSYMVQEITHTKARLTCTRKTLPGLRALEKYAVRMGGAFNHRFGLFDAVLIKDNHLAALNGNIRLAVQKCRDQLGHMVKISVEVDHLTQIQAAIDAKADAVLLDNMTNENLVKAVALCEGNIVTEASGGVRPENIRQIAETGVDYISCGFITHSAPNFDVGLDFTD